MSAQTSWVSNPGQGAAWYLARPRPSGRRRSSCWYRAAGPSPCPVWPHLQGRRRYARQGQVCAPGAVGRPPGIEGPVVVFTLHDEKGFPTMSVTAPPALQKPSILAAFTAAPTLVKVLAAILYAIGLLTLIPVSYTHLTLPTNREV